MVPGHVWRLVKPYGLEPGEDELSGGARDTNGPFN
jgi:hypothetical protein